MISTTYNAPEALSPCVTVQIEISWRKYRFRPIIEAMDDIYYDEDLFYLNELIHTISDGFRLDLQSELFIDKSVDDIMFVENTIAILYGALMENELVIKRAEHIKRLVQTKVKFAEMLDEVVRGDHGFGDKIAPFYSRFREMAAGQRGRSESAMKELRSTKNIEMNEPDVVSEQEIRFLLMEENSEEPA